MNKHIFRETWLADATKLIGDRLFDAKGGYKVPPVAVACGWPSTRGLSAKKRVLGEAWAPEASATAAINIFISPYLSDPCTEQGVLSVLAHELVHATVGNDAKHGPDFKRCATAIGLEGKMTSTVAPETLLAQFRDWVETELGPYPHGTLDQCKGPKKVQTTRMLKAECGACGYTVRLARKWIDDVGEPHCPKHGKMHCEKAAGEPDEPTDE